MCCSTGVCGPEVDPILVQFATDLDALGSSEVKVDLSQSPHQFATTPAILALLREKGAGALPAILVDGTLVHHGSYPGRAVLSEIAGPAPKTRSASSIERARAALETGRSVFLGAPDSQHDTFLAPFLSFASNPAFAQSVEVVELTGRDDDERGLMTEVGLPGGGEPAAVLIMPPGYIAAQWVGSAREDEILVRFLGASSRCAPGGSCCS
jgi:hypothetical protein